MVTMIQCIFRSHLCRPMLLRYGDEVLSRYSACLSTYIFWHLKDQADQKKADLHLPSSNDTPVASLFLTIAGAWTRSEPIIWTAHEVIEVFVQLSLKVDRILVTWFYSLMTRFTCNSMLPRNEMRLSFIYQERPFRLWPKELYPLSLKLSA